ncbi:MAG: hypothetical protein HXS48_14260 [Theionarchaea archaeon]|nr:hypothetical protein [Theionarchaea archaeon]
MSWETHGLDFLVFLVLGTILIDVGAKKYAKIPDATTSKNFVIALIGAILAVVFGYLYFLAIPIAFVAVLIIVKAFYKTTWGAAFKAWIIYFVILLIYFILLVLWLSYSWLRMTL